MKTLEIIVNDILDRIEEEKEFLYMDSKNYITGILSRDIVVENWKEDKPEECPVCYENVCDTDVLSCGHYIHKECIINSKKTCCAICRKEVKLSEEDAHKLFVINYGVK
jgi:hypothetical protein